MRCQSTPHIIHCSCAEFGCTSLLIHRDMSVKSSSAFPASAAPHAAATRQSKTPDVPMHSTQHSAPATPSFKSSSTQLSSSKFIDCKTLSVQSRALDRHHRHSHRHPLSSFTPPPPLTLSPVRLISSRRRRHPRLRHCAHTEHDSHVHPRRRASAVAAAADDDDDADVVAPAHIPVHRVGCVQMQ